MQFAIALLYKKYYFSFFGLMNRIIFSLKLKSILIKLRSRYRYAHGSSVLRFIFPGNRFVNDVSVTIIIHPVITNDLVRSTTKAYDFFFMTSGTILLHAIYV